MSANNYILDFSKIGLLEIGRVGGKNASLGELRKYLTPPGVNVPDGFAATIEAYRLFLRESDLGFRLRSFFSHSDPENTSELQSRSRKARTAILDIPLPRPLKEASLWEYRDLRKRLVAGPGVAVRSSATAEQKGGIEV